MQLIESSYLAINLRDSLFPDTNYAYQLGIEYNNKKKYLIYIPLARKRIILKKPYSYNDLCKCVQSLNLSYEEVIRLVEKSKQENLAKKNIRILLTDDCNIFCDYCSVESGLNKSKINIDFVKELLAFEFSNSSITNYSISLSGGEPTLYFDLLAKIVSSCNCIAKKHKKSVSFSLLSNGVFPIKTLNYIMKHFSHVQLSYDGNDDCSMRKTVSGKSVGHKVIETATILTKNKVPVSIRIVLGNKNYSQIEKYSDDVKSISEDVMCDFTLVSNEGRAVNHDNITQIDENVVTSLFIHSWLKYGGLNSGINFSGTDITQLGLVGCGIQNPSIVLTPDGYLSACPKILNYRHPLSNLTIYGEFNNNRLIIDDSKKQLIQRTNYWSVNECHQCFAYFHCHGGCPVERINFSQPLNPMKCAIIRKIVTLKLLTFR